ncbi:MAG: magnesium transporter [Phycisphaerae bacterium]|nr:magnesium transporter [Phycisphaerae bacterium]NIP32493.1 magnesium transporter [Candidatus Saccharibacteria bacterium]NIW69009.1 magnesium transporter [candidate division KSB1 bacterium]NIS49991.1 magnesium transporter [Phycisphaerae bacterium]NIU08294.1 magnesium transporter [Phycisphaerae bacterium]
MADEQKRFRQQILLQQIEFLLDSNDAGALAELLKDKRSSDISEVVELLGNEQRRIIFDVLEKQTAAEVLEKVDEATRRQLFDLLTANEIKTIISELDLDDAADLLAEFPQEKREELLQSLEPADSLLIKKLMSYSEDSAGGIMDPVLISTSEDATVAEAVNKIRAAEIDEDFYSVFVVDKNGKFLGDVRIRLLLTRPENTRINDLIDPDTIYVVADDDQERVRNVFRDNDLIVAPVLDRNQKLVGRITADRIIEVADEEAAEDIYTMAGTDPDELDDVSVFHAARVRMTWLLPCLIGTGITALVLIFFHGKFGLGDLARVFTAAVAFVPMIAAISGNAGLQTSAIVVSGLATGHLAALKLSQVFNREVRIALIVALSCGIIGGLVCAFLLNYRTHGNSVEPVRIVLAFTTAMFSAIMVATTLGLLLPFLFRRIGIDPAISSGPLVTTANDSISVAIYMTLTLILVQ